MQVKLKKCAGCNLDKVIWKNYLGNKYCKSCWQSQETPKVPSNKKPIKPKSDKKDVLDVLYSKLRKEFLNKPENATCRAKLQGCLGMFKENLTVHHTKGRGRYYLDMTTWIPLCLSCHEWVETHPKEAREMNLSQSKLT
jgi:hypothetical protein